MTRALLLSVLVLGVACAPVPLDAEVPPAPILSAVTPASGPAAEVLPVVIEGEGLTPRVVQHLDALDGVVVDDTFAAFLGETELLDVVFVDETRLDAAVPAELAPGVYALRVVTPHDLEDTLPDAFEVTD